MLIFYITKWIHEYIMAHGKLAKNAIRWNHDNLKLFHKTQR